MRIHLRTILQSSGLGLNFVNQAKSPTHTHRPEVVDHPGNLRWSPNLIRKEFTADDQR